MCYHRKPPPPRPPLPGVRIQPYRRTPHALRARQLRSLDTRERLIGALELVIRDVGIERATVRAIAARANLSVGAIYRRFRNKRALVLAAQERFLARRAQRARTGLQLARTTRRPLGSAEYALAQFVNGALLAIERDRPLLLAFARAARSDAQIHAGLAALIGHLTNRPASRDALDVLLTALRGHVLDPEFPSGRRGPAGWVVRCLTRLAEGS